MSAKTTQSKPMRGREDVIVPSEYKRTEVGVIPSDWIVAQLAELVTTGPRNGFSGRCTKESRGTPTLSLGATTTGRLILSDETVKRLEETIESRSDLFLQTGDVLVQRSNTLELVGTTALFDGPAHVYVYPDLMMRMRFAEEVTAHWFWRYANSAGGRRFFVGIAVGSSGSMPKISGESLRRMPLPLPPRTEQRAIGEALSDVDGLLGALETLIAKKRAIKQAAMQQLLTGKTRLPGFGGEWETKRLGELATVTMGQSPQSKFYNVRGDGLPLIQGNADIQDRRTLDRVWTTQVSKKCHGGDLLLTVRAPVGAVGIATMDACLGRGVCGLKPFGDSQFLFHALVYAEPRWKNLEQGSTFTSANSKQVGQFILTVPHDESEQTAIATVLSDIDAEIDALERRRDKTRAIKQGMMQQLLTGRVRLVKPEAPAAQGEPESKTSKAHSWAFNEAVVISALARRFGKEQYPLGRKRYTKLSYLLHRHAEKQAEGYVKKAAGPYNPKTKYGGPEKIAIQNGYIREHRSGKFRGFVADDNIAQAERYFEKWYGPACGKWLEQFRRKTNDELELLATVDMAVEELRASQKEVDVDGVKEVIRSHPEWEAKLDRPVFCNANIAKAIETCQTLFG